MKQSIQLNKLGKLVLLSFIISGLSLAASAQIDHQKSVSKTKIIELNEAFNEIEIIGDATIILTNSLENQLLFTSNDKITPLINTRVNNGKLVINTSRKSNIANLRLYVPASTIGSLIVSGNSKIFSSGTIRNSNLEILLNGSSKVSVNHEGKLNVIPGTGYEIVNDKE